METEITISIVCDGKFVRGTKEIFDKSFGNWLPPESPEIEDFKVFLVKGDKKLDITDFLTEHEQRQIYSEYIEACMEEL